ncbi:kinase-like protein [Nemania sp. FL0031]|nr:kinase-like protein [Nemania sp. FL0031]
MSSLERLPASRFIGSSAVFFRVEPGVILKAPVTVSEDQTIREWPSVAKNYIVERQIFDRLGQHPRIVRCLGWRTEFPTGLLLVEASHGSLQRYIATHNETILLSLRKKWFRQAIESIDYIHGRGVIHSDLRPDNFLVDGDGGDLWLCDFGKSACEELKISSRGVPDSGFLDPNSPWKSTPSIDIFSLGSVLYTIVRGHWPYRAENGPFETEEEMDQYEARVDDLFGRGIFPEVEDLFGGEIILGCWTKKYATVQDILKEEVLSQC